MSWGGCYGKSSNVAVYSRTTLSTPVCFSNSKFKDNRIIRDIKSNRNNPSEARLKRVFILFHERKKWISHIECISHPYAAVLPLCASWTQSSKPEVERKGMLVTLVAPYLPRRIIYLVGLSTSPDYTPHRIIHLFQSLYGSDSAGRGKFLFYSSYMFSLTLVTGSTLMAVLSTQAMQSTTKPSLTEHVTQTQDVVYIM